MLRRKGFFVRIHRDMIPHAAKQEWVEVEGAKVARWGQTKWDRVGWQGVSRELSKRDAIKIAKAYQRAGFHSQVTFRGADQERVIIKDFDRKRNA